MTTLAVLTRLPVGTVEPSVALMTNVTEPPLAASVTVPPFAAVRLPEPAVVAQVEPVLAVQVHVAVTPVPRASST